MGPRQTKSGNPHLNPHSLFVAPPSRVDPSSSCNASECVAVRCSQGGSWNSRHRGFPRAEEASFCPSRRHEAHAFVSSRRHGLAKWLNDVISLVQEVNVVKCCWVTLVAVVGARHVQCLWHLVV